MCRSNFRVHKVLLEHSLDHLLLCCKAKVKDYDWDQTAAHKTENIYYLVLYRKNLPTPLPQGGTFFSISSAKSSTKL